MRQTAVRADVPEWLWPSFAGELRRRRRGRGRGARRARPVDLRVNRLKAERDAVLKDLAASPAGARRLVARRAAFPARP